MKPILVSAACLAALLLAPPVLAKGDAEKGKLKAYTCTGCHGIEGYKNVYPHYHVPKIAGQNYDYLVIALTAYQKGERKHPTMQAQAESFTAEDIADIATYLAGAGADAK
jgi:cytochrome c553